MKKNNKKGFTLAELLIVVAIIAVLTAIAIPVFTSQLEKSREATDIANVRSAYANLVANYITDPESTGGTSIPVSVMQKQANWQTASDAANYPLQQLVNGSMTTMNIPAKTSGTYNVTIDSSGSVSVPG